MSQNIYELLQAIIPELAQQDLPDDLENYDLFLCTRQISQNPYPIRILPS